jgi:hypothetical protein
LLIHPETKEQTGTVPGPYGISKLLCNRNV